MESFLISSSGAFICSLNEDKTFFFSREISNLTETNLLLIHFKRISTSHHNPSECNQVLVRSESLSYFKFQMLIKTEEKRKLLQKTNLRKCLKFFGGNEDEKKGGRLKGKTWMISCKNLTFSRPSKRKKGREVPKVM